jgi:hypothetical protein
VDSTNTAQTIVVGIYSDDAGNPDALLGQATISAPRAGAWNSASLPDVPITAGRTYWLAILQPAGTSGRIAFRDNTSRVASQSSSRTGLTTLSSSWSPGTRWATAALSAYVTP